LRRFTEEVAFHLSPRAVANIRVLTWQLFVNNVKLCDEDVTRPDYALARIDGDMPSSLAKPVEAPP
jgi:hypothetical protein